MEEPRFLLDKDSMCYRCKYYVDASEVNRWLDFDENDVDENGGICDCGCFCVEGSEYMKVER